MTRDHIRRDDHAVSGSDRPLTVFTVDGMRPGPVVALLGAVHGDEMEGPLALSRLLAEIDPAALAGRLIVAPLANAEAVAAYRRTSPGDDRNLARCFPGREDGSYTEALAAAITRLVIEPADALVDLHSGGIALDSVTFAGYGDAPDGVGLRARAMAEAFGAPYVWRHAPPMAPGRSLSVADARGIPAIYVETGGGTFPAPALIDLYFDGLVRVLRELGHLEAASAAPPAAIRVVGDGNLDIAGPSPVSGIVTCHIRPGTALAAGALCFTIADLDGAPLAEVRAPAAGHAMFVRRNRWVENGELLMAMAVADDAP